MTKEICGHYVTEFHRKNAALTGDPGCTRAKGHEGTHVLSTQAWNAVENYTPER